MVNNLAKSICTRCGRTRIIDHSYKAGDEGPTVIYTVTRCPNDECQGIVDQMLMADEKKRMVIKADQVQRENARRHQMAARKRT